MLPLDAFARCWVQEVTLLSAIGLRNWAAVQVVIFAFVLTLFVGLQLAGLWMPSSFLFQANVYVSALAGGGVPIWWSWWRTGPSASSCSATT